MYQLIKFFIENTKFTLVLILMVVMAGLMSLKNIKVESFPAVDFAIATISTVYPGASPIEVETKVTKPLEDEIRMVSGLKDVRSISQAGRSFIVVRLDMDNVNIREVMVNLQQAINRVSNLPPELPERPLFTEVKSNEFPVIEMALVGSNLNRQRDQLAETLQDEIENIDGVLTVRLSGQKEREFVVNVDQHKMDQAYFSLDQVTQHIINEHVNSPAGDLVDSTKQHLVRMIGEPQKVDDLGLSYLRSNFTGKAVQLKDIAEVKDGMRDPEVLTRINGKEATLLIILQKGGSDTVKLVDDINAKISDLKKVMPKGYELQTYLNIGDKIINRVNILSNNALAGLLFV
ncbi:hypothetical protein BVY03_01175, partial [bacterium K02(2017)]